jgi:hypothetical protein
MKKEQIQELFNQFENACYDYNSVECWSARELQNILGYSKWDNFLNVIEKAKKACENAGAAVSDHFADIGKMIDLAKGAQREIEDIALTRYERGVKPEQLPPSEDLKKVQRRLEGDEKKVLKDTKKIKGKKE